jgi:hypothetical protein
MFGDLRELIAEQVDCHALQTVGHRVRPQAHHDVVAVETVERLDDVINGRGRCRSLVSFLRGRLSARAAGLMPITRRVFIVWAPGAIKTPGAKSGGHGQLRCLPGQERGVDFREAGLPSPAVE